jgi:hypothetical protein
MKLSELVTLNNQLKSLTVTDIHQDTNCRIEKILYEIQKLPEPIDNFLEKIDANNYILQQSFVQFENELSQLKLAIKDQIHKQQKFIAKLR